MSCCIEDGPVVFSSITRKARVEHTCCECGGKIQPRSEYVYSSGLWDGLWDNFKQCEPCASLSESLSHMYCTSYGELFDSYAEFIDDWGRANELRAYHQELLKGGVA